MKKKIIPIIFLLIAVFLLYFYSNEKKYSKDPSGENAGHETKNQNALINEESGPPKTNSTSPVPTQERYSGEFCRNKISCKIDILMPNSEADLLWMRKYGYPTPEDIENYSRMTDAELEALAKKGTLSAMTAYGSRLVERNDPNGRNWIFEAKNRGSIYSYYGASNAEMNRNFGEGFIEAGAYLRVAYILGDHRAASEIYRFIEKNKLSIVEMQAIDLRAGELYQTYAKNRQPVPRPL